MKDLKYHPGVPRRIEDHAKHIVPKDPLLRQQIEEGFMHRENLALTDVLLMLRVWETKSRGMTGHQEGIRTAIEIVEDRMVDFEDDASD